MLTEDNSEHVQHVQTPSVDEELLTLRIATPRDAAALLEIYAPYVRETAVTFEREVPSLEEFERRITTTLEKYPYIVAEQAGKICAYAYAGPFKTRAAYEHSIETSIYVNRSVRQIGIGSLLYMALENVLFVQNITNLNACIAVPICENDPYLTNGSKMFHEKQGYKPVARFHGCAYKFNRWYDIVWMEKLQGNHADRLRQFAEECAASQRAAAEGSAAANAAGEEVAGEGSGSLDEMPVRPRDVDHFIPFSQLDPKRVRKLLSLALLGTSEDARSTTDSAGAVVFRRRKACGAEGAAAGDVADDAAVGAAGFAGATAQDSACSVHDFEVLMIAMKSDRRSFPKGHIMPRETREAAAVREIREETGIQVNILPEFCYQVASARKTDKRNVFFFLAEYVQGDLSAQEEEIDKAFWVHADEVADLISFANDRTMYQAALEEYLRRLREE